MIQLLDENDKAQIEQKIKTVSDETNSLKEDIDYGFNDNVSYKRGVYDALFELGSSIPLVNTCITISEVLKTFLIESIKLYVKSSTADTITVKILKEPKYGSE